MHPLIAAAALVHEELEAKHREYYEFLRRVRNGVRDGDSGLTQGDRADLIYFLKGMFDFFDDLRKETRADREQLDAILATVWVVESATPGKKPGKSVKGAIGIATPRLSTQPAIPSPTKEPTKYGEMCRALGVVNEEVIQRGLLRLHWPSATEWCTELSEQGRGMPASLDPSKNQAGYTTTARKRTDIDLDAFREEARNSKTKAIDSTEYNDEF